MKKYIFKSRHVAYKDQTVIEETLEAAIEWVRQSNYFREPFWEEPGFVNKCRVCYTDEEAQEVAYDVSW